MRRVMRRTVIVFVGVTVFPMSTGALGWQGSEVEPNDTFGTGQVINAIPAAAIDGTLMLVDVDFFRFNGPDGLWTMSVFDFTPDDGFDNDSIIGIFDPTGLLVNFDDDDGPGFLSSIHFFGSKGLWGGAVSGFGDDGFDGSHGQNFAYRAVFSTGTSASEVEKNDTVGTANVIPRGLFTSGAVSIAGALAPGDVDFYSISLANAGALVTASVFDFTPDDGFDNDSILGVFGPDNNLLVFDDDDGPGFLSGIHFFADEPGTYTFAVSGFGDDDFLGDHGEAFDYRLVISIPAPGSLALLGLAGLVGTRRRRA